MSKVWVRRRVQTTPKKPFFTSFFFKGTDIKNKNTEGWITHWFTRKNIMYVFVYKSELCLFYKCAYQTKRPLPDIFVTSESLSSQNLQISARKGKWISGLLFSLTVSASIHQKTTDDFNRRKQSVEVNPKEISVVNWGGLWARDLLNLSWITFIRQARQILTSQAVGWWPTPLKEKHYSNWSFLIFVTLVLCWALFGFSCVYISLPWWQCSIRKFLQFSLLSFCFSPTFRTAPSF